jgi:hypothetical protein
MKQLNSMRVISPPAIIPIPGGGEDSLTMFALRIYTELITIQQFTV